VSERGAKRPAHPTHSHPVSATRVGRRSRFDRVERAGSEAEDPRVVSEREIIHASPRAKLGIPKKTCRGRSRNFAISHIHIIILDI
jgi:hypothetical protein